MQISVIIPTYNEGENIAHLVKMILRHGGNSLAEVIVVDGHSRDDSVIAAQNAGAKVIISPKRGRAAQMNYGASMAKGELLYFVHADVQIHPDFSRDILHAVTRGYDMGCYRFVFDSKKWLLKLNAWFTRLPFIWCRGGDQTLFIKKEVFKALGGYHNDYLIMEDYDLIKRAHGKFSFGIIPKNVVVSARKYDTNSYLKVQRANYAVMHMWQRGVSQEAMVNKYKEMLQYRD